MAKGPQLDGLSPAEKRLWLGQLLREKAKQGLVFPLSHGQRGLWILNQMDASSAACNIHFPSRIRSPLNIPALARSLQSLVDRHPSLRTTFESRAGLLVQRVHETMAVTFDRIDATSWSEKQLRQHLDVEVHRPFDLEQGPLLRTHLFTRAENDHILLTTAHHIVLDFWSVIVLLQEIRDTYPAECDGRNPPPAPKSSDYADFVRWQADLLAGPGGQRLRSFWKQHLEGVPHVLELPTDRSRPPSFTYRAGGVPCSISADLTRQLAALAVEQKATLYTVLLSTLQVHWAATRARTISSSARRFPDGAGRDLRKRWAASSTCCPCGPTCREIQRSESFWGRYRITFSMLWRTRIIPFHCWWSNSR